VCEVFGIAYSCFNLIEAVEAIADRPQRAPFAYIATPNATHVVGVDRGDAHFVSSVHGACLRTCDSQVVRLFAWLLFRLRLPQAAGSDITRLLFETKIKPFDPLCVIGGTVEMAERLRHKYGLQCLVQHIPPYGFMLDSEAMEVCAAFVRDNPSRFVFLACGAPQSETLGLYIAERGGASGLGLCIGASLLFLTGIIRRAPRSWRRCGFEWLYRLIQALRYRLEETRIWRRKSQQHHLPQKLL
jgi:exopolysaccharide biosynthesis WecB/TagA/CpsF family protein